MRHRNRRGHRAAAGFAGQCKSAVPRSKEAGAAERTTSCRAAMPASDLPGKSRDYQEDEAGFEMCLTRHFSTGRREGGRGVHSVKVQQRSRTASSPSDHQHQNLTGTTVKRPNSAASSGRRGHRRLQQLLDSGAARHPRLTPTSLDFAGSRWTVEWRYSRLRCVESPSLCAGGDGKRAMQV